MKKQLILLLTCTLFGAGSMQADDALNRELYERLTCPPGTHDEALLPEDVPRLLFRGADPLWKGHLYGLAAVHHAAKRGLAPSTFREILNAIKLKGGSVDFPDINGYSALCHAALNGNARGIELLAKNGAEVNFKAGHHKYTPLHFAVFGGHPEVVQTLQGCGAIEVDDASGRKPSYYARRNSKEYIGNRDRAFKNREQLQLLLEPLRPLVE